MSLTLSGPWHYLTLTLSGPWHYLDPDIIWSWHYMTLTLSRSWNFWVLKFFWFHFFFLRFHFFEILFYLFFFLRFSFYLRFHFFEISFVFFSWDFIFFRSEKKIKETDKNLNKRIYCSLSKQWLIHQQLLSYCIATSKIYNKFDFKAKRSDLEKRLFNSASGLFTQ